MARDRYSILGLGRARATWLGNVSGWVNSGNLAADFAKCLSVGDVRQRLNGLQKYSVLMVEAGVAGVDRDLIDLAVRSEVAVFVIDAVEHRRSQWLELGAATVVSPEVTPEELLYNLATYARVISTVVQDTTADLDRVTAGAGSLIAVTGSGGVGTSTVIIALAQIFADDVMQADLVALADLARNGEQAMLHDTADVVPGIEELVDASRTRSPSVDDVRELTFHIATRRYRLLLGQRKVSAWANMPPAAVGESLKALRRAFRTVVADVTADFENERDGGSLDVEERNALARSAMQQASSVVVVGTPGMKGTHALARTIREVMAQGVDAQRIVAVVNKAGKDRRVNAEVASAITQLIQSAGTSFNLLDIVFVPERAVDLALRDGVRLPKQIVQPLEKLADQLITQDSNLVSLDDAEVEPEPVRPGSLGILGEAS